MGRRKFRLSDMMPNAWFYKLRDMRARSRRRGGGGAMQPEPQAPSSSRGNRAAQKPATPRQGSSALPHRASYYYTARDRELTPSPPRPPQPRATDAHLFPLPLSPPKNSRRRHRVGPVRLEHAPAGGGLVPAPVSAHGLEPLAEAIGASQRRRDMCIGYDGGEFRRSTVTVPAGDDLRGKVITSETDIVIDLRDEATPERVLRPITTRPARRDVDGYKPDNRRVDLADMIPRASSTSEQSGMGKPRRSSVSSGRRLKTRANSPRMTARKGKPMAPTAARGTTRLRSPPLGGSYAMVKSSDDPRSDFLDSMAEMIDQNGIRDPSDLEDLLACYLSLNSVECHGIIIDAFEQIWTSLASGKP